MKPATRLYVPDDLAAGVTIALSEGQAHQLRAVLRLESGATIALFNGRDGEFLAEAAIEKRRSTALVISNIRTQTASDGIALAFAPIKPDRMAFLVEKATELGVARLLPVITARTQNGRLNVEKLANAAREAAEQCERLDVPLVEQPQTLAAFLASWNTKQKLVVCAEAGDADPIAKIFTTLEQAPTVLIGPEGGFTSEEFTLLRSQPYVVPVTLGTLILRAETAALTALAAWRLLR